MKNGNDWLNLLSEYRKELMGFSALWILIFHEWEKVFTGIPVIGAAETFVKHIGFCGVDIFILLSGFGLTYAIEKYSMGEFYYHRLIRVYPSYALIALICTAMGGMTVAEMISHITLYRFFFVNIYGFLWFVPMIILFYLCFPPYYHFFKKTGSHFLFLIMVLEVWTILSVKYRNAPREEFFGVTNRIPIFLIGIYFGWLLQNRPQLCSAAGRKISRFLLLLTLLLGLYFSYLTIYRDFYLLVPESNCCIPNILISISLPFLLADLLDVLKSRKRNRRCLLCGFLSFYGKISLEIYCVQQFVVGPLLSSVDGKIPRILFNVLFLGVASAAAWLLHLFAVLVSKTENLIPHGKKIQSNE